MTARREIYGSPGMDSLWHTPQVSTRSPITTHALDTALGTPARGLGAVLERLDDGGARELARGVTNDDGRITDWLPPEPIEPGIYRVTFATREYLAATDRTGFYPRVVVEFEITDPAAHHHVPLLLSPWGYSTYRGS